MQKDCEAEYQDFSQCIYIPAECLKDAGVGALLVLEGQQHFFRATRLGAFLEADGVHVLGRHPTKDHPGNTGKYE